MSDCLKYLQELPKQMSQRLEIPWQQFKILICFLPTNALWDDFHFANQNIINEVIQLLPRCAHDLDVHNIIMEWDQILNVAIDFDANITTDTSGICYHKLQTKR